MAEERGSTMVTPTREDLSERTAIRRLPTITAALTALSEARWIRVQHVPVIQWGRRTATLLRILLLRSARKTLATGQQGGTENKRRSAQKTLATGTGPVAHEKRSHSSARKTLADFPKGKGRPSATVPSPTGGTVADAHTGVKKQQEEEETRPIADIVQEAFPDG